MDKIVIAIDGYSSCGKSTLAKDLAKALGYLYIDSGAMYRAVTLYAVQNGITVENHSDVIAALSQIQIHFEANEDGGVTTFLNNENVERLIRSQMVAEYVSEVSVIKEVREFLVEQQRKLGANKGIVMDGRDIGTVVFPEAELKLFVTADLETRAKRRYDEMISKGDSISMEDVKDNLQHRDLVDTQRKESPLYKADDATLIDNSLLSRQQQLNIVLNMVNNLIAVDN